MNLGKIIDLGGKGFKTMVDVGVAVTVGAVATEVTGKLSLMNGKVISNKVKSVKKILKVR